MINLTHRSQVERIGHQRIKRVGWNGYDTPRRIAAAARSKASGEGSRGVISIRSVATWVSVTQRADYPALGIQLAMASNGASWLRGSNE